MKRISEIMHIPQIIKQKSHIERFLECSVIKCKYQHCINRYRLDMMKSTKIPRKHLNTL